MGLPKKNAEYVAGGGVLISFLFALLTFVVAGQGNSIAARVEAFHLFLGALVWAMTYLHLRARRLAAEEKLSIEETDRSLMEKGKDRLFEGDGFSGALAQTRLRELEKYGVPLLSVLIIAGYLIVGGLFVYALAFLKSAPMIAMWLGVNPLAGLSQAVLCAFLSMVMAFLAFALGVYAAGMAQESSARLLRAGAGHLLANALCLFLITLVFGLGYLQWTFAERVVQWLIPVLMLVIGGEMLINFVLDFYRPRTFGEEMRPVYDSRLTGLMTEPQGLFKTFSQTMDYQFGFKISDTWFFRFLEKAIAPLLIFQLLAFYLLTCVVVVRPGEVVVFERWGRPIGITKLPALNDDEEWNALEKPREPGLYLKYPWPIDITRRVRRDIVREIYLGSPQKTQEQIQQEAAEERKRPGRVLISWDTEHVKDEFKYIMPLVSKESSAQATTPNVFGAIASDARAAEPAVNSERDAISLIAKGAGVDMLSSDVGTKSPDSMFVSGQIKVQYVIGRGAHDDSRHTGDVYRFLYGYDNPDQLMISICERETTKFLAGSSFWDLLVDKVADVEKTLRSNMQQAVDEAGLGVQIVFVGVSDMHPPAGEVGKAYQQYISAQEERRTIVNKALGEQTAIRERVPGQIAIIKNGAEAYSVSRVMTSRAEASRFEQQLTAYKAAPEVYRERAMLTAVEDGLKNTRIVIKPAGVVTVIDDKQSLTAASIGKTLAAEATKE